MTVQCQLVRTVHNGRDNSDLLSIALGMLLRAHRYATSIRSHRWQFAIELEEFQRAGVTRSELRWLLASGLAQHAKEVVDANAHGRTFVGLPKHLLPPGTCFVLSDDGVAELAKVASLAKHRTINGNSISLPEHAAEAGRILVRGDADRPHFPQWDQVRKELRLDGVVVKQFRCPAPNQEAILAAFQEEQWSARIDDPLPPASEQDSRRRLSDAIKYLNRNQVNALIRFRGDGTGKGVLWELRERAEKSHGDTCS